MFQPNAYYYPNQPQQTYAPRQVPYEMPQQNLLKGRFVSSVDEVRAAQVDFDGSIFIFPDLANNKIYTKQINMDGTASLKVYDQIETVPEEKETPTYVTQEEFSELKKRIDELAEAGRKSALTNYKVVAIEDGE